MVNTRKCIIKNECSCRNSKPAKTLVMGSVAIPDAAQCRLNFDKALQEASTFCIRYPATGQAALLGVDFG